MREPHPSAFGSHLRRLREAAGLTQEQLAERAGLSVNAVSQLERGERRSPYPHTIGALADALGLPEAERATLAQAARQRRQPAAPRPAPPAAAALLGRERELRRARELFGQGARLLTITGPGGVGKTSLAMRLASELAAGFTDGAALVDATAAATVEALLLAIAQALDAPLSGAQPPLGQIIALLRDREQLLVLDNLEHLLGEGQAGPLAALIQSMRAGAAGLRLLVTSREPLRLRDEWVLELAGLAVPRGDRGAEIERSDAAQLFLERARRVAPGLALDSAGRAALAQICRQLEGVPLAIELAAAWARALSPTEIARELDEALDFLSRADRDAPARHRSMRATLDHSWALLGPDEQSTLARMAVFRGGADRAAAAAVAGASLATLSALVEKSLVRRAEPHGDTRYSLHELVRQYAAARLAAAPAEQQAAEAHHMAYYAALLRRALDSRTGASSIGAQASISAEIDNLRAAWAQAASSGDTAALVAMARGLRLIYDNHGWLHDGALIFGQALGALRAAGLPAGPAQPLLLGFQSYFLLRAGQLAAARPLIERGWAELERADSPDGRTQLLYSEGIIAFRQARPAAARARFAAVLASAAAAGDEFMQVWAGHWLGVLDLFAGDYPAASRTFAANAQHWGERAFPRGEAVSRWLLGEALCLTGQLDAASRQLQAALQLASTSHDTWSRGLCLIGLGALAQARGELDEAGYLTEEGAQGLREVGDAWLLGRGLAQLVAIAVQRGDRPGARRACAEVVRLAHAGEALLVAEAAYGLALILADAGALQDALGVLAAAADVYGQRSTLARIGQLRAALAGRLAPDQPATMSPPPAHELAAWLGEIAIKAGI